MSLIMDAKDGPAFGPEYSNTPGRRPPGLAIAARARGRARFSGIPERVAAAALPALDWRFANRSG